MCNVLFVWRTSLIFIINENNRINKDEINEICNHRIPQPLDDYTMSSDRRKCMDQNKGGILKNSFCNEKYATEKLQEQL